MRTTTTHSEIKNESKEFTLFPISARAHFIKSSSEFQDFKKFKGEENYQHVETMRKPESNNDGPQQEFGFGLWYKIQCDVKENSSDYFRLCTLMAAIYRFEMGDCTPQEYSLSDKPCRISGGFSTTKTFFLHAADYRRQKTFDDENYLENLGRIAFIKWLYLENDFRSSNILASEAEKIALAIDPGQSLAPLTLRYIHRPPEKKLHYFLNHKKHPLLHQKKCKRKNIFFPILKGNTGRREDIVMAKQSMLLISDMSFDDMGYFTTMDYNKFPLLNYSFPENWAFFQEGMKPYGKWLAKYSRFTHEKHFSALKSLITHKIKQHLIDIHTEDQKLNSEVKNLFNKIHSEMFGCIKDSTGFLEYFKTYKLDVVKAAIYETLIFLEENKHYAYKEEKDAAQQWNYLTQLIIEGAGHYFEALKSDFDDKTKAELKEFADNLRKNAKKELLEIKDIYDKQLMHHRCKQTEVRIVKYHPELPQQDRFFAYTTLVTPRVKNPEQDTNSTCLVM